MLSLSRIFTALPAGSIHAWRKTVLPLASIASRGIRTPGYREERVTTNSDGSVIICWHPEPKFPYEMTRPVPRGKGSVQTDSKLQVKVVEDMKELYHHKPDRFKVRDLMRLTWTSKYKWTRPQIKHRRYYNFDRKYPRERPYM